MVSNGDAQVNIRQVVIRRLAVLLASLGCVAGNVEGVTRAHVLERPYVKSRLVQVDVYDRADGEALPVYASGGRQYIVGTPGHEYAVRIRNCTGGRLLAVTSVDGVNVITGDTASPSQSGYVIDPWSSVEIAGWRKNMERTAAFYFTDLGDSYAARTGRPHNVGVVGVAVFQESPRAPALLEEQPANSPRAWAPSASAPSVADSSQSARKSLGKLGTGHGRSENDAATSVAFERSTDVPLDTVAIQYDRRENLIAMHVLPRVDEPSGGSPNPFPAVHFVPDPTW